MWVIGEPISVITEAVERKTGILTEVDTYDWITFLPMSEGTGAYNRYFGRLNTGKMKIRGVAARKGDTPEYINKMQQDREYSPGSVPFNSRIPTWAQRKLCLW